jgi:hypothetical protein
MDVALTSPHRMARSFAQWLLSRRRITHRLHP